MKKFIKNIYLIRLQRKLRNLEKQKINFLKKFEEFKVKADASKKIEIADYAFLAFIYKKAAKNYEEDLKKVAKKIAKLKA